MLWSTPITLLPQREKIASSLNYFHGNIIAVTGGYIGDASPYQGHVAILDAATGNLTHVWNSLCSDRHALINPSSCMERERWAATAALGAWQLGDESGRRGRIAVRVRSRRPAPSVRSATGRLAAALDAGRGHWNSPIAADGRIALPEGSANDHATGGVIDIWRLR